MTMPPLSKEDRVKINAHAEDIKEYKIIYSYNYLNMRSLYVCRVFAY